MAKAVTAPTTNHIGLTKAHIAALSGLTTVMAIHIAATTQDIAPHIFVSDFISS